MGLDGRCNDCQAAQFRLDELLQIPGVSEKSLGVAI